VNLAEIKLDYSIIIEVNIAVVAQGLRLLARITTTI
jgi:hypothetical protein